MKKLRIAIIFAFGIGNKANAQETIKTDTLKDIIVSSTRIDLPFKKNSRTIQIITSEDIHKLGVTNVADALQQVAGIDVRRQGINGTQADLYIRGGSFDQSLLLIDGIKVDDPQTGHHTLNLALPIEVIERIEIIKGPAARIFGQNAFTGAVNIVTKKTNSNELITKFQTGSFGQFIGEATGSLNLENSNHIIHFSKNISEGYRENTDLDNQNIFINSHLNTKKLPINFIASHSDRKFGANGFYGIPSATQQYEETQGSLIALSTLIKNGNLTWKPKLYWRRNQDEYIYIRNNPAAYRNLHITNKIAAELNGSYKSALGTTGFGIEFSKYYIGSNRLGDNQREIATLFLEHRFQLFNNKLDLTPGFATSYFSDFDNKVFPGLDVGYKIQEDFRIYANIGYTYRVPTYTDLYYIGPQATGNENLQPEEALSQELGIRWTKNNFNISFATFNRDANNLIDYVRLTPSDVVFSPLNIQEVNTKGMETQTEFSFYINDLDQKINIGYTFMEDDIKQTNATESRYSINSIKHHIVSNYQIQWFKNFTNTLSFRYVERTTGSSYNILDINAVYKLKELELSFYANNIFNKEYSETSLIPMPKGNVLFGLKYFFR